MKHLFLLSILGSPIALANTPQSHATTHAQEATLPSPYLQDAYAFVVANRYQDAILCYQKALESYPNNPENSSICCAIADCLVAIKKPHEASVWYKKALDLNRKNTAASAGLGNVYVMLGQNKEAIAALEEGIMYTYNAPVLHYNLGCALMNIGNMTGAEMAFHTALSYDPHYANASFKLLELLFKKQEIGQAYTFFIGALQTAGKKLTVNVAP